MNQGSATNAIPILNQPAMTLNFGRMDSDYTVVDHTLQIENQDTLSGKTYDMIKQISSIELNMTKEQFQQLWKTLLLKRAQDVYEMEKQVQAPNKLDINSTTIVPAPLADIATALGSYDSTVTGHTHHIVPPAIQAENAPPYANVDDELITEWTQLCSRQQHHYTMKVFPEHNESENRPLVLTYVEETQALVQHSKPRKIRIKAYTNEPTPTDALLRSVNDDLFREEGEWTAINCSFYMTPSFNQTQVIDSYVGAYVLDSNA